MGEVYLAEDPRLERKVALKRPAASRINTPEAREQLRREARAAAHLNHPNIAVVYDVIDVDDQPFIVMEYVEGKTLLERRLEGPMSPYEIIDVAQQLASALAEAHNREIIHRDLKPSNILLTPSGKIKILDFGLARKNDSNESENTTAGQIVGTPAYMAPEQKLGYRADQRTDIYAFGLVLFELATGRSPATDRANEPLVIDKTGASVARVSDTNPAFPEELSELIARAMSWEPKDRQQSAEEIERELDSIDKSLEDEATLTKSRWSAAPRRQRPRPRTKLALAGAIVLALLFAALLWRGLNLTPDGPPVVAVVPLVNVSGDPSMDHIGVGISHTLITKLSAVPSLTIISPSTLLRYGADSQGTAELARDLGASYVVSGSVQRMQDTLHITVNLVRADDSVVWGSDFEGKLDDLFELQRRLSSGVATALHLNLSPAEARELEAAPTRSAEAYAEFSQGRSLLERRHDPENNDRAIRLFESAIRRDPEFVQARAALAEAYWAKFEQTTDSVWTERARAEAEEALSLQPDDPAVRYSLALIHHETGESEQAITELERTLALKPRYDDAYALLGQILADNGKFVEGAAELQKAIDIRPSFWGHYSTLGLIFYRAGRMYDAAQAFQRITELQPDLPNGFQMLGTIQHAMGDYDRAVANYRKAIELGYGWAAYLNLGTILYRQRNFTDAVKEYRAALELNATRPATYRNLGDAYQRLGSGDEARASYSKAAELTRKLLEVNPKDASSMGFLAVCEAKLGHFPEARRLADEAIALSPQDGHVLYRKAVVEALAGDPSEAMKALVPALEQGYSLSEAREDDDLETLHQFEEFQQLISVDK